MQYHKPVSAFRTQFDYDNLLYIVAGEVVARVSGLSWAEFVQTRIMEPLEMNRSAGLYQNLKVKNNIAIPHSSSNNELKQLAAFEDPNGIKGANGGIYSSANDMSKYLLMHLNGGKYGKDLSEQMISEQNHAEMLRPHTGMWFNIKPKPPYKNHFGAYGLGWLISDQNGYIIAEHGGALLGMLSNMVIIPELNVGFIVLTNSAPGGNSHVSITKSITDAYIGVEKKDWIAEVKGWIKGDETQVDSVSTAVWKIVDEANTDHLNLNDFVGTYSDNWFGNIEITNMDGKLRFRSIRSPKLNGEMFYYKANTFAIKWDDRTIEGDAFAHFVLDENGKAISINMKGISPRIDFSFDYQDLDLKRIDNINKE